MFINNFDPAIQIFSIEIRWSYSYIVGILLSWFLSKKIFINDEELKDKFDDFITYLILGIVLVKIRLCILLYFSYYFNNFSEIFKIWQAGCHFMEV